MQAPIAIKNCTIFQLQSVELITTFLQLRSTFSSLEFAFDRSKRVSKLRYPGFSSRPPSLYVQYRISIFLSNYFQPRRSQSDLSRSSDKIPGLTPQPIRLYFQITRRKISLSTRQPYSMVHIPSTLTRSICLGARFPLCRLLNFHGRDEI